MKTITRLRGSRFIALLFLSSFFYSTLYSNTLEGDKNKEVGIITFDSTPTTLPDISCNTSLPMLEVIGASSTCDPTTVEATVDPYVEDLCAGYMITYRWLATDDCGDTAEEIVSFNVLPDTEAPIFNSSPMTVADVSCDDPLPTIETLTATDNCGNALVQVESSPAPTNACMGGTMTYTWTAIDDCDNSDVVSITFNVLPDTEGPVFDDQSTPISDIGCDDPLPTQEILTATDACGDAFVTPTNNLGTIDPCAGDQITYTWRAVDNCNNSTVETVSFNVVPDVEAPVFDVAPSAIADIPCNGALPTQETLTATDNCSNVTVVPTVTNNVTSPCTGGIVTYTWTATDDCNNITVTSITFNVLPDTEPPIFDAMPSPIADINCGDPFPTQETITASDNCSTVTVTVAQTITQFSDPCVDELVTYIWTATDDCNNSTVVTESFYINLNYIGGYNPDSLILVDLYNTTNGAGWSTPWTLSDSLYTWEGVHLNSEGRVRGLNLAGFGLEGELLESLIDLDALEVLLLNDNQLLGCFPHSYEVFCNNTEYDFSNNVDLPNGGDFDSFCSIGFGDCGRPHLLYGNVFQDEIENCVLDTEDDGLTNWIVEVEGAQTYYTITDATGNYEIYLDESPYTLNIIQPIPYWEACVLDTLIQFEMNDDSIRVDFPNTSLYDCPSLRVDISTPFLRRCFENNYMLSYCNEGFSVAENAYVEITFDSYLSVTNSSIPWSDILDNTYTFELGDIAPNECGSFSITTLVDCDSTFLGQTHCVEAMIYPDTSCLPIDPEWDGSVIMLEGECLVDSIEFRIINTGVNDMTNIQNFIVTEDEIMLVVDTFILNAGEIKTVKVSNDGFLYRMLAEQSPFNPTDDAPSVSVEGCGDNGGMVLGTLNDFPENDASKFISIDCQENIASYDPNDKRVFPNGVGDEHAVYETTDLEYHIRFQNTGTDTAFTVVVRDTISPFLDITTLQLGTSSHPYTFSIDTARTFIFTFNDILLVDSFANEPASHGFLKFKIRMNDDLPLGTIIENNAAIYFDFNEPVITNEVFNTLLPLPIQFFENTLTYCEDDDSHNYTQDTTLIDTLTFTSYQIISSREIVLEESSYTEVDSFIYVGESYSETIIYSDEYGCDSIVTTNYILIVPTENIKQSSFSIYPNPVQDGMYINYQLDEPTEFNVAIYDVYGKKVKQEKVALSNKEGQFYLTTEGLAGGVYFLKCSTKDVAYSHKFLKL